ncbi:MAG: hypothetical protein J6S71_04060 [Clostridia bacterium]|nr:hypothetical protein [Clostridia bacterium]
MRKVYLTRDKSFVGCLGKLNVYVEDVANAETVIADIPCRKVCKIANGETVSFDIPDEEVRVIVIADKLSKNLCNDYYRVPAGVSDVEIGGKCTYNPGAGNPFRFHGVTDEDILANRKRTGRKGLVVLIIAALIGFVMGFVGNMDTLFVNDKVFTADEFEITLTTQFAEDYEDGTYYFGSRDSSVAVTVFDFDEYAGIAQMSEREFLNLLKSNEIFSISAELKNLEGLLVVEEQAESQAGDIRSYLTVFIKSDEAFYIFEFGCENEKYQEYRNQFIDWAKTIVIK